MGWLNFENLKGIGLVFGWFFFSDGVAGGGAGVAGVTDGVASASATP